MRKAFTDIHQIFNPAEFQKIQDDISSASELAVITVDYKGVPVTAHSNCSEFCEKMRSSQYGVYCEKCDSHGGLEAARLGKPFIYLCHAGLIDIAIPIIVDGLYLGALMAGQVLLEPSDSENQPEHILQGVSKTFDPASDSEMRSGYAKLPVMRLEKVLALSNMLSHISNYCVEQAVIRDAMVSLRSMGRTEDLFESSARANSSATGTKEPNKLLAPALSYIKAHPHEKISLPKMACLCSISTSYFSKLFARENFGNLSDYVNRTKTERAKELLRSTDWSVGTVAENLGFDDCGYFIKVFKRGTGKTPLEYRNLQSAAERSNNI